MRRHLLILAAATAVPYALFLNNPWSWDDRDLLVDVKFTHHLDNARYLASPKLPEMWPDGAYWRPAATLSFLVDHALWKFSPAPRRAVNLLLHALTTGLLYGLARGLTGRPDAALAASLLFAMHPVQGENMFIMCFRQGTGAGLGVVLGLLAYRRWPSARTFRSSGAAWLALGALLFGLGFKEQAAILPVLLWLHDRLGLHPDPEIRPRWSRYAPFVAGLAAFAIMRFYVLSQLANRSGLSGQWLAGLRDGLLAFPSAAAIYARLAIWPHPLAADHAIAPAGSLIPAGIVAAALLGGSLWTLNRLWKTLPVVAFGLAWAELTLLPLLIPVVPGTMVSLIAERYVYLPAAGVAVAAAGCLARVSEARVRAWRPLLIVVCLLYAGLTIQRGFEWRVPLTLYTRNVAEYPNSYKTQFGIGGCLQEQGRLDEARLAYEKAIAINPARGAGPYYNLGLIYLEWRDFKRASAAFEQARGLSPGDPSLPLGLGNVELAQGRLDAAEGWYRRALELNPTFDAAQTMLEEVRRRR